MSNSYAKWLMGTYKKIEKVLKVSKNKGISKNDVLFYMKRNFGTSDKMVIKYIDELEERGFIELKDNKLYWQEGKENE